VTYITHTSHHVLTLIICPDLSVLPHSVCYMFLSPPRPSDAKPSGSQLLRFGTLFHKISGYYHPLALSNAVSKFTSFPTPASHVPHHAIRQRLWLELAWICALYKFCNNNDIHSTTVVRDKHIERNQRKGYKSEQNEQRVPVMSMKCECWDADVCKYKVLHQEVQQLKQLKYTTVCVVIISNEAAADDLSMPGHHCWLSCFFSVFSWSIRLYLY